MTVCRACRSSRAPLKPLWTGRRLVRGAALLPADMLAACAPNTVGDKHDGFPAHICLLCYRKLCSAYKFRMLCESSYAHFVDCSVTSVKLEDNEPEKFNPKQAVVNLETNGDGGESESEGSPLADDYASMEVPIEAIDSVKSENETCNEDNGHENEDRYSSIEDLENSHVNDPINVIDKKKEKKRLKRNKHLMKLKKKCLKRISAEKYDDFAQDAGLTCNLCPKTFKYKYLLVAHQDWHLGIKRYFCEICQKSYRTEKDHINMHRRGFKFKCDMCGKCFNTKAKLTIHKEIHSEERERFPCDVEGCGKFFLSMNGLERHRLSHSGLKNFICQMCSKSFIDRYQLDLHIRTHTNDRRYTCNYCDKKFITRSAKSSHERWHLKTKNYVCQHCEKAFVTSSGLKRHLLCHSKDLPETCRFCGKKFARYDNKKRHEMAMHYVSEKSIKDVETK